MKKQRNHTYLYLALSFLALFSVVVMLIMMFMDHNQDRILKQNQHYLEDAVYQSAKNINTIIRNASDSIALASRLYELQMDSPEFDYRLLNDMAEKTLFDYMRFIGLDGISYSGDGTSVDCRDREYYIYGIQGQSGVCHIETSRFTGEALLIFYTPLYYQGEIVGVVNGTIQSKTLTAQMEGRFFDEESISYLCLRDGAVVAASGVAQMPANVLEGLQENLTISKATMAKLENALMEGQPFSYQYTDANGKGNAYLAQLENDEFMLLQMFPAAVSQKIMENANKDALHLEIGLIAAFIIYIVILSAVALRRNRRLSKEKENLGQIVDSVKRLYKRFVVVDLEQNSYEYLKEGDISLLGLPSEGRYDDWLEAFQRQHEKDPQTWSSMEDMSAERLRESLTKENWYSHRDYRVFNDRWERLSLIKLDMDEEVTSRLLGAVEDITEIKKKDEESRVALEAAYHTAEAANRAKSDFLSRMSHDIRTPMNAIIGLTAIMGAHLDERDRIVDSLSKITASSKHLLGLINEVLDMSKIESGKLVLSESEFSLSVLVDDLMGIVQPTVNAKRQELTVRVLDLVHEDVIGDSLRLQQVCVNILSNAVKYSLEGGHISFALSELPSKQPLLGEYMLVIEDDGIGMPPEFLDKIFTPFERVEDDRVHQIQGTGLGMSIAQSIVQLMGGSISVESELGKGSRFTVRFSLKLQEKNEEAEERLMGLPVLVADDDQVACESTCLMLSELGMHSEWVLTGQEAVDRVVEHRDRNEDFFAVILDWKMPGMDGVETARAIRQKVGPDVPIIILSAYDWSEIENEARAAGVNAFIGKPLFKSRLRGVFVNFVSDVKQETENTLSAIQASDFTGKRILLVEDNLLNQEIAKEILEMSGLTVDVADNGKLGVEAYEASSANYYDMIFMDIQMPVMNGYEATRAIRELKREDAKQVPIVAMTANTFNEDVQAAMDAGMNQHIGKPLDIGQLTVVLEKWLG